MPPTDTSQKPVVSRTLDLTRHRLKNHPHLRMQRIWCEVDGPRLFLRGQVPSFYLKQLAQEAVNDLENVSQVVNEIEVVW